MSLVPVVLLLVVGEELVALGVVVVVAVPGVVEVVVPAAPVVPTEPFPFTPVVSEAGVQPAPVQLFVVPGVEDIVPGAAVPPVV